MVYTDVLQFLPCLSYCTTQGPGIYLKKIKTREKAECRIEQSDRGIGILGGSGGESSIQYQEIRRRNIPPTPPLIRGTFQLSVLPKPCGRG
jgi:hypothetical protein